MNRGGPPLNRKGKGDSSKGGYVGRAHIAAGRVSSNDEIAPSTHRLIRQWRAVRFLCN